MKRRLLSLVATIGSALLVCSIAAAQETEELVTDRPDQTESSRVVPAGSVQVEVGALYERSNAVSDHYDERSGNTQLPAVLLRIGFGGWFELRGLAERSRQITTFTERGADSPGPIPPTVAPTDRVTNAFDWGVGGKVQLMKESGIIPEAAFIGHLMVQEGGGSVMPEFRLCMSNSLSPTFGIGYNVGGEYDPEQELFSLAYTLALGADVSDTFGGYVELFGDWNRLAHDNHSFDAGLTWLLQDNLQLDLAGGVGLTESAPDYFLGAGFSVRFPR